MGWISDAMKNRSTATVVLLVMTVALGGCMNSSGGDAEAVSAQQGKRIEHIMPGLVRAAGWDAVGRMSEVSCTGSPSPERAPRATRWTAGTGRSNVDQAAAERITAAVREHAESTGWVTQETPPTTNGRVYHAIQDDLVLNLHYRTSGGGPIIELEVTTSCLDMPAGHTMTRSEFDPMYGSHDPLYPNDDRSKFTNGKPKPFPSSSTSNSP